MHEIKVMNQVVQSVLQKVGEGKAKRVNLVRLQVGELAFLGHTQLEFAFELLSKNEPMLKDTKLIIEEIKF